MQHMRLLRWVISALLLVSGAVISFAHAKTGGDLTPRLEKLAAFKLNTPHYYKLDNGLELLIYEDKRAPVVAHSVWYKVGAADELDGESGLAHFFEHLMFKGTKNVEPGYFSKFVARIGGEDNAYTTNDYTVYYQNVASEFLPNVMKMEADRMVNLQVPDHEFYLERDVVLEERSMRVDNNPAALLSEQMSSMLYRNHPYGSPTIGWRHEIAKLTPQHARDFYKRYYAPNNAIVTIVGDVDPDEVLELAQKTYGKNKAFKEITPYVRPSEPPQNARRFVTLADDKVSLPSLFYYMQGIDPKENLRELYAFAIGLKALGSGDQSYLYRKWVKEEELALSIGVYTSVETIDAGPVMLQAMPSQKISLEQLDATLQNDISEIVKKGLSDEDIQVVQSDMIVDFIRSSDSRGNMARFWGTGLIRGIPIEELRNFPANIANITPDEVNEALRKVFRQENRVVGYLKSETKDTLEKSGEKI
ncbi:MAG: pitrilysin family protein [Pseudomonadota bacterium]